MHAPLDEGAEVILDDRGNPRPEDELTASASILRQQKLEPVHVARSGDILIVARKHEERRGQGPAIGERRQHPAPRHGIP